MKKLFMILTFWLCFECLSVSSSTFKVYDINYYNVQTQRDYAIEHASRIFPLNDIVVYIIDTAIKEKVDPVEILAYIKIENPKLISNAVHKNYSFKKIYDKKKKKYINKKIVQSKDIGIGQLNDQYIKEYEWFYWKNKNEEGKFDPYNYKHNVKVSIRIFKTLKRELNNRNSAVVAYNAGIGKVLKNDIPQTTLHFYLPRYLSNLEKMGVHR